jgi:lysophospholipase L1-like esterase
MTKLLTETSGGDVSRIPQGLPSNLLLSLISILLTLVAIEGGMRLHHAYRKARTSLAASDNPEIIFTRKPHARPDFNSMGFRDRARSVEKPAGIFRILVLGDSVTEGLGVDAADIYTRRLESLLNQRGTRFEVVNLGVSQYSTTQEVAAFRESGVKMSPDLAILAYVLNDAAEGGSASRFFLRDKAPSLALHWLVRRAGAVRGARDSGNWLPGCERFDYVSRAHCDADGWARITAAFRTLGELSRRHGFHVLLVVFPLMENGPDASFAAYKWTGIHRQVIDESARHGFSTLDLLPAFARWRPAALKISPNDRVHPNPLGHRIAADALYRQLVDMRIAGQEPASPASGSAP